MERTTKLLPRIPSTINHQISDGALGRRQIFRGVIGVFSATCLYLFYRFFGLLLNDPSSPLLWVMVGSLIGGMILLYLALVRVDSGKWSIVHPLIPRGIRTLRMDRKFVVLLAVGNVALFLLAMISVFSGYIFSRHGTEAMIVLGFVWVLINASTIFLFSVSGQD